MFMFYTYSRKSREFTIIYNSFGTQTSSVITTAKLGKIT